MPPKRKTPAAPTTKSTQKARRSKLAKEHDISPEEEAEMQEAFNIFRRTPSPSTDLPTDDSLYIPTASLRPCLIALNAPPRDSAELHELVSVVDPEASGWVRWEEFVGVAALKVRQKNEDPESRREEAERAFKLFTRGEERAITLADLKKVARELREDVDEGVLRDMLREATGGEVRGVGVEEFEGVMGRAGVFG